jgi:hypothetical protein
MEENVMYKLSLNDYVITKDGKIFNKINNHLLKPYINNKGYQRVVIGGKKYFVHRLVAELYVPNPENKMQVNHIDGNKQNNHYSNLEWVTNQENRNHALKNNLHFTGSRCSWSKLNEEKVIYIRNSNLSYNELAKKFNVSERTIKDVKNYKSWKQLKRYAEL